MSPRKAKPKPSDSWPGNMEPREGDEPAVRYSAMPAADQLAEASRADLRRQGCKQAHSESSK